MSAVDLLQPILEGVQRNNFFNGRLLSAEDLRAEQEATRAQDARLARTVGEGVAWGLDVAVVSGGPDRPTLRVSPGLALTRLGALLSLREEAQVTLAPSTSAREDGPGLFADCVAPPPLVLRGDGAYVLAIAPAAGFSGTALVGDPNTTTIGRGSCGARFSVEGLKFRLVPIDITHLTGIGAVRSRVLSLLPPVDAAARERLRNLLAHLCFGTAALGSYFSDPAATIDGQAIASGWGVLDAMRSRGDLTDCDVPLAVVVLTASGISFVDAWSARRRPVDAAAIGTWRAVAGPRRVVEGEAAFLQFQAQLEGVAREATPSAIVASSVFDLLPAAGWLPAGFSWVTFLGAHAPPSTTAVDAALLRGIIERSWFDEPFALNTEPPVPLHVYQVPEESFVVFARSPLGHIRVVLSPQPQADERVTVTATAATGAITRTDLRRGATLIVPDLAPGRHSVTIEAPDYVAIDPLEADAIGARTVDLSVAIEPLPEGSIVVDAIDRRTNARIAARDIQRITASGGGASFTARLQEDGRWLLANLPAETYVIRGIASGYENAVTDAVGPTARGRQIATALYFARRVKRGQPSRCVSIRDIRRPPLSRARLCMVLAGTEFDEQYYFGERGTRPMRNARPSEKMRIDRRGEMAFVAEDAGDRVTPDGDRVASDFSVKSDRYAVPTGEIVYAREPWRDMVALDPVSDDVRKWLLDWREWIVEELDDRRIGESMPVVYIDPNYRPPRNAQEIPQRPPAYAVFRRLAVPLSIQLEEGRTRAPVDVGRAGLRGLPDWFVDELIAVDIKYIDDFAWSWEELLLDATGDPPDVLRYGMADAMTLIQTTNQEFGYYSDVDSATAGTLRDAGITDDVALANADPTRLGERLGSQAYARRLINEARAIVPRDTWSLDVLGLSDHQVEEFGARGIDSQGLFAANATRGDSRAMFVDLLGLGQEPAAARDAALSALANLAVTNMAQRSVELAPEHSLSLWEGADAPTATRLGEAGFQTVEDVAAADPDLLASQGGMTREAADRLIGDARAASRAGLAVGSVAPVSRTEERALRAMLGTERVTLGDLAGRTPEEVASAFGGNVGRATAVLNGIRAGLGGAFG